MEKVNDILTYVYNKIDATNSDGITLLARIAVFYVENKVKDAKGTAKKLKLDNVETFIKELGLNYANAITQAHEIAHKRNQDENSSTFSMIFQHIQVLGNVDTYRDSVQNILKDANKPR